MAHVIIGLCTVELYLPGMTSLKEKRSALRPLMNRLHKTFNISISEVDHQDVWRSATIAFATVSNSTAHTDQLITQILKWIEDNYPHIQIVSEAIEIL